MELIAFFTAVGIQPVEMEAVITQGPATQFHEVVVVGKEKYLGALSQLSQLRENRSGTVIIACDQQIIEDKGHRLMLFEITIKRSQTKGEVELIPGTVTHPFNRDRGLIRAQAHQDRGVVSSELCTQPLERAPSDATKDLARFFQQRTLIFLSEPLDLSFQEMRS
jgi:hypothetical protein